MTASYALLMKPEPTELLRARTAWRRLGLVAIPPGWGLYRFSFRSTELEGFEFTEVLAVSAEDAWGFVSVHQYVPWTLRLDHVDYNHTDEEKVVR